MMNFLYMTLHTCYILYDCYKRKSTIAVSLILTPTRMLQKAMNVFQCFLEKYTCRTFIVFLIILIGAKVTKTAKFISFYLKEFKKEAYVQT